MKVARSSTPFLALGLGLLAGVLSTACRSSYADCDGQSGCECSSTADCLTGLTCIDNWCVDESMTDTGDEVADSATQTTTSESGDSDTSDSGDGDSSDTTDSGDGDTTDTTDSGDGDTTDTTDTTDSGDGDTTDTSDSGDGDGDGDTTDSGDGDGDGGTTGSGLCQDDVNIILTGDDASLVQPFQLIPGNAVGEPNGVIAESGVGGVAVFDLQVPCADTWYLWIRVRDAISGVGSNDADALRVELDGDISDWWYGCQTAGSSTPIEWLSVETGGDEAFCQLNETNSYNLAAGVYQLDLENLEAGSSPGNAILISRVMLTNDPNYVPSQND